MTQQSDGGITGKGLAAKRLRGLYGFAVIVVLIVRGAAMPVVAEPLALCLCMGG
jgi:hypothetical protein